MPFKIIPACTGCTACARICPVDCISGERGGLFVIESAQCIECGACGRICPAKAVLDSTGVLCTYGKRSEWLIPVIDRNVCVACAVCIVDCPVGCLAEEAPLAYPILAAPRACIGCGICAADCPVDAIQMVRG